jgi:predicted NUDIX family NTP pyrophosphohydrolase
MARRSAGILLYRPSSDGGIELLIVHPGGPFWARRDAGAWSLPKGEHDEGEEAQACALRELEEELGERPALGELVDLGEVRQKSGKVVHAWGARGDFDPGRLRSSTFEMEWPPRSGRRQAFPEVDRAAWLAPAEAAEKLIAAQAAFVERLLQHLAGA